MRGVFTYDAPRPHDFHHQAICSGSGRARTFKQISPRHFSKVLAYLLAYASKILSLGWDSNPHAFRPRLLRPLRIPIPPPKVIVRVGLEPTRPFGHKALDLARLPIPPSDVMYRSGEIRTHTEKGLSLIPLPVGLQTVSR